MTTEGVEVKFKDLPPEEKEAQITHELGRIDLNVADPLASDKHIKAIHKARGNQEAIMRADIEMLEVVSKLRLQGKMLPLEELKDRAKQAVNMGSDEMRAFFKAFDNEHREARQE